VSGASVAPVSTAARVEVPERIAPEVVEPRTTTDAFLLQVKLNLAGVPREFVVLNILPGTSIVIEPGKISLTVQDGATVPLLVRTVSVGAVNFCACALPPNAIEPNATQLAKAIKRKFMEISQRVQLSVLKIVSIQEFSLHLRVSSFC